MTNAAPPAQIDPHQAAVDEVVAHISAARGTPELAGLAKPGFSATYNTASDELSYHSDDDAAQAAQAAQMAEAETIDDGIDILESFRVLTDKARAEVAKLNEKTYDPNTGAERYVLNGNARAVQERVVGTLLQSVEYQEGIYNRALENRATRAAAKAHADRAKQIAQSWTGGDPARQKVLDDATMRAEAEHIAQAVIRAKLGHVGVVPEQGD